MIFDTPRYNGWENRETRKIALEYFSDSALVAECIEIDVEDAVFQFAADLRAKTPGIHKWTLREELASKLESWMLGYLDSLHTELEYDQGDHKAADELAQLLNRANVYEIALTHCQDDEVTELMKQTVEDCASVMVDKYTPHHTVALWDEVRQRIG